MDYPSLQDIRKRAISELNPWDIQWENLDTPEKKKEMLLMLRDAIEILPGLEEEYTDYTTNGAPPGVGKAQHIGLLLDLTEELINAYVAMELWHRVAAVEELTTPGWA